MELIEKQAAMNCCFKPQVRPNEEIFNALKMAIRSEISHIQSVDAAPVRHGRWVMDEYPHDGDVRCSVCLIAIDQMHERNHKLLNALTGGKWYTFYRYCPQCGAKMDLEGSCEACND